MKLSTTVHAHSVQHEPAQRLSRAGVLARLRQMARERASVDADVIAQCFRREDRKDVRRFAATSFAHADIAQQFSLLAYLVATRRIPAQQRLAAECAIASGATLPKIAAIAGVPMWTRQIPPSSCIDPQGQLPASASFACRISDVLRRRVDDEGSLRGWLRAVAQANNDAGEEFALWLACRYPDGHTGDLPAATLRMLVLWYLASKTTAGQTRAMIHTRWRRDLSLETGVRAARNLARRIDLELLVGPSGIADPWFPRSRVMNYDFIPLTTSTQIRTEALKNENCLDTYGQRLAKNEGRVYSVCSRDGDCVANVEIAGPEDRGILPRITQIKAPKNEPASPLLVSIADIWLQEQVRRHGVPDMRRRKLPAPDAKRWAWIIAPLSEAGTLPAWAVACPAMADLERTELEFSILGYRLHARGWRFG